MTRSSLTIALSCGVESEGVPAGRAAEAGPGDWLPTVLTARVYSVLTESPWALWVYTGGGRAVPLLSKSAVPRISSAHHWTPPRSSVQVHREPQWQEGLWAQPSWGVFLAEQKERYSELGSAYNHGWGHFPGSLQITLFYTA